MEILWNLGIFSSLRNIFDMGQSTKITLSGVGLITLQTISSITRTSESLGFSEPLRTNPKFATSWPTILNQTFCNAVWQLKKIFSISIFCRLPAVHRISTSNRFPPLDVVLSLGDEALFLLSSALGVVALELSPGSDSPGVDALDNAGVDSLDGGLDQA